LGAPLPPLVLAYHGIADVPFRRDPRHLFVRPAMLARHLRALRAWGYRPVRFGELAARAPQERAGLVALTFDDGLADNHAVLLPLLVEEGLPATVFVVSSWLGGRHPEADWAPILSADQLRDLHRAGVEIGGHSTTHADLTALSAEEARAELQGGRDAHLVVEERLQRLAAAACSGGRGSWDEPFALPREDVGPGTTRAGLRLKRSGRYEQVMRVPPARAARRAVHALRRIAR
jgi:peptidoglycan/xylan/chitin deacetylase (PgdA/CDA1 family)